MTILYRITKILGVALVSIPFAVSAATLPTFSVTGVQDVQPDEALVEVIYDSQDAVYAWNKGPKVFVSYTNTTDGSSFSTISIDESKGSRSTLLRMQNLKPDTKYTYKGVMYYDGQRYETAEQSFRTKAIGQVRTTSATGSATITDYASSLFPSVTVVTKSPGITKVSTNLESIVKTGGYGNKNGVALAITDTRARVTEGQSFDYTVQYHNSNKKPLRTARIVIQLPDQYMFDSGDGNTVYSNTDNIVTIYLGSIGPEESGTVLFKAKAQGGENAAVETKAVLIYTGGSVSAVDRDTFAGGSKSVLGATVFGSKFFPQTFFGWLLIIVVLIIIMIVTRRYMSPLAKKEEKK